MEDSVTVRFVLPVGKTEATCSEDLSQAFDHAQDSGIGPIWATTEEVMEIVPAKTDVFVLDPFSGPAFDFVSTKKSTILGPRCLLVCIQKGEPVPELPYPMYTAAMKNLIVTSTGFDKEKKVEIQKLVESMAGIYSNAFHDGITHLVADVVRGRKYEVAVSKETPIMTIEWVREVWTRSKSSTVHAVDPDFSRFKCPALFGLTITVSQMNRKDKELLRKSIEAHGGNYTGSLDMDKTNALIIPTPEGDKYSYARKWKIPCLSPSWVFDSIEQGYCLPTNDYKVETTQKSSTPTKNEHTLREVSMCSTILNPNDSVFGVNETVQPNNATMLPHEAKPTDQLLQMLDLSRVKKAGNFLDGCRVFVSGFSEPQQEHLRRVLQAAGAVRMTQLTQSVTHMIIKTQVPEHVLVLKELNLTPHQVNLQWLVESMHAGRTVKEEDFLFAPSKRGGKKTSMGPPMAAMAKPPAEEQTQFENDLMAQYKQDNDETITFKPEEKADDKAVEKKADHDDTTLMSQADQTGSDMPKFLLNKKLAFLGFNEDSQAELDEWVSDAGGELVFSDFAGVLDYLILPVHGIENNKFKAKNVVSNVWLEDCLDNGKLMEIEYYHKPLEINRELKPMKGVVLGITGYSGRERQFIASTAEAIGMIAQEIFAKREKKGAKQSTHLVCAAPEGNKYQAAIKWGLPVVDKDWIMACVKEMKWVSEKPFLVGDSTAFTPNKPMPRGEEVTIENDPNGSNTPMGTPNTEPRKRIVGLETPSNVDIEKLRPKPLSFDVSASTPTRMQWDPDSQSQPSPSLRRKQQRANLPMHLVGVKTPETPYGAFLKSNPSPKTRKFWKKQCDELGRFQMTDEAKAEEKEREERLEKALKEREDKEEEEEDEWRRKQKEAFEPSRMKKEHEKAMDLLEKKGLPVLEREKRSFDELMEEKMKKIGKSWMNPAKRRKMDEEEDEMIEEPKVMEGVVLYVTRKLAAQQSELGAIVESLGGEFRWTYDPSVTHVVFVGKTNDITKEFRQARDDGKKIVCPDWVFMCRDEGRLIEEKMFPHNLNAKMSLNVSVTSTSSQLGRRKGRTRGKSVTETFVEEEEVPKPEVIEEEADKSKEISENIAKLDEFMNWSANDISENDQSKRRSMRMTLTSLDTTPTRAKDSASLNPEGSQADSATESQVKWEDPKEKEEREKLKARLSTNETQGIGESQGFATMDLPENLTAALMDNADKPEEEPAETTTIADSNKKFMMSTITEELRREFVGLLEDVGSGYSTLATFDPSGTHIITGKLGRTEKLLGAIATGKWVLHESFVNACLAESKLLDEAAFEWGNPDNGFLESCSSELELKLAKASFKWRKIVQANPERGAYDGITAIIHTSDKRKASFQRLLEYGRGKVIDLLPPYSDAGRAGVTHCIAEPDKLPKVSIDYEALAASGVAVVGALYINEYLISDPAPATDEFLIECFKPHWLKRRRKL